MEVECQVICLIITLPFDPNIKSDFTKLQKTIILNGSMRNTTQKSGSKCLKVVKAFDFNDDLFD